MIEVDCTAKTNTKKFLDEENPNASRESIFGYASKNKFEFAGKNSVSIFAITLCSTRVYLLCKLNVLFRAPILDRDLCANMER